MGELKNLVPFCIQFNEALTNKSLIKPFVSSYCFLLASSSAKDIGNSKFRFYPSAAVEIADVAGGTLDQQKQQKLI